MVHNLVLLVRAPDRVGLIAGITPPLADAGCDVREASFYGDPDTATYFLRMHLNGPLDRAGVLAALTPAIRRLDLQVSVRPIDAPMPILIAVSRFGHCLDDLLYKWSIAALPVAIAGVVSNHDTMQRKVEWHGLPYHHLPTTADKAAQEAAFLDLTARSGAELVVLARYMQVLSPALVQALDGRCINIHHSFLPSFKGAKPYHQAHARGVKLIGATAHYVTTELDEGPIIEQDVRRVTHATTADEMVALGRETEASVLSRAVKWHAEHRILVNGARTVVLA